MLSVGTQAQRKNSRYVDYIDKYKDLAIEQMKEHKIPASITLAQGLLESGAGMSELARKSNNHFGITSIGQHKTSIFYRLFLRHSSCCFFIFSFCTFCP